ncbi:cellulase family glycosylhydrolase [Hamadaea sp. NPDC050747]|uniref:cellulase family glycosylhydrolase n=1 Tax=Hamadaea sp. NPDC050747 TaxID=3155789 RepID=UPI0033DC2B68
MTLTRRHLLTAAGVAASAALIPGVANAAGTRPGRPSPQSVVDAMQPGWNLGNTFDSTGADETSWGNPRVTRELIRAVKGNGFNSIRIPVTWAQHLDAANVVDPAYLARVQEVVGWALAEGLYVLINVHHDSWQWVMTMPTDHDAVLARFTAIWTQVAQAFRDASPRLLFESVNEPFFNGSSGDAQNAQLMAELNTTFHQVVRASGGPNATRLLVLPTLHTSPDQPRVDELTATLAALNDPNLVATVHFYGFWPFSVNIAGFTRFDATVQKDLTDIFDRVHDAYVAKGIPVIIGEYGLLGFDRSLNVIEQGEKLKFFEFLGYYARQQRITTMWWDNGQHLNRTTFQWSDPDLIAQIKSSWCVRSATAATDLVFVGKSAPAADQTVTLSLNGAKLTGIFHGGKRLAPGRDYILSGDQLTFPGATLARLTGDRAYGVNAVLSARFDRGVPWKFRVITNDLPVLQDATGTTNAFKLPAAFNGDLLATMEAKYADGSFAGPQNWTSYKEFAITFSPDYAAGTIALTDTFFNEVTDGSPVTLTFHFWSGATVQYTVVRSGGVVTGTA